MSCRLALQALFIFLPSLAFSQVSSEQLQRLLVKPGTPDTTRVRLLNALAGKLIISDPAKALPIAEQSYALARQVADVRGEIKALLNLSVATRRQSAYDTARYYALECQRLAAQRHDKSSQAKAFYQLSLIDNFLGNPTQALRWAQQGLLLVDQTKDRATQGRLQYALGRVYYQITDYSAANKAFQVALKALTNQDDERIRGSVFNDLGNIYHAQEDWSLALSYFQRAVELARHCGDTQNETTNEINIAEIYGRLGNHAQFLEHGRRARALALANADTYNMPALNLLMARMFMQQQRHDSAIYLAQSALAFYQQTGNLEPASGAADLLAQAYAARSNYAQAYKYQQLNIAYQDSILGDEVQRKTAALRYGYELDKKQAQITLLNQKRQLEMQKAERQRQQLYGSVAGLAALVLLVGLLWRNVHLKQKTNRRLNEKNEQIASHRDELDRTLTELKAAQAQLVQREKMAMLGELTAGVAHEIQNPLNFVNNFADLSVEMAAELQQELATENLSVEGRRNVTELLKELIDNQKKIHQHGLRADSIVKGMLVHSRNANSEPQSTDLNNLVEESVKLALHELHLKQRDANVSLVMNLDPHLRPVVVIPQDLNRVLINLLTNAFYSVLQRQQATPTGYQPTVQVSTRQSTGKVEIKVRDNGKGLPAGVANKIFQPFFTTKPTGEGTGLGLWLSYDIVCKVHGGTLTVDSQEGEYAEFLISLPLKPTHANIAA